MVDNRVVLEVARVVEVEERAIVILELTLNVLFSMLYLIVVVVGNPHLLVWVVEFGIGNRVKKIGAGVCR